MKGHLMLEEQITPRTSSLPASAVATPPQPGPQWAWLIVLTAAAGSGLMLTACFFPLSWGALSWGALVPLLVLVRTRAHLPRPASWEAISLAGVAPRRRLGRRLVSPLFSNRLWVIFCAWVSGSVFYWIVLSWMPWANEMMAWAWRGLSVYCALYFPVAILMTRWLDRRSGLPLFLTFPMVWVGLDFIRSFLATGFPWYFLGHTQHIFLPVIQVADLGGAYFVTFLVVMVNAQVFEGFCLSARLRQLCQIPEPPPEIAYRVPLLFLKRTALVVLIMLLALGYGMWRLNEGEFEQGPRVALLQGNVDQNVRNDLTSEQQEGATGPSLDKVKEEYLPLCDYVLQDDPRADLMIWPETAFPHWWVDTDPDIPIQEIPPQWETDHNAARAMMRAVGEKSKMNVLLGLNTDYLPADFKSRPFPLATLRYNTALLVRPDGTIGGQYEKIHRIPFGEYTPPIQKLIPLLHIFSPYKNLDYGIQAGKEMKRITLSKRYTFGVLICYEDSDPVLARQYGAAHSEDFTLNPFTWLEWLRRRLDGVTIDEGQPVDFLVNMSNDGWYAGTSEHNEHLAISRFRAVETRRSLVRAVNMGISAVIDGNGSVLRPGEAHRAKRDHGGYIYYLEVLPGQQETWPVSEWNSFKKVSGVLTANVPIDHRVSLYAQCGDWLPYGCWLIVVGAGLVGLFRGSGQWGKGYIPASRPVR
jgi:apolipoprotein N-acyltransferase